MNMKLISVISVIIPVYNSAEYLSECIKSVISQTYTQLEIILINDGSTDNSGEICDKYASQDKRIIVIHQENGGVSAARNTGLERANGEYIGFIDSDDTVIPEMFEKLLTAINKHNKQIAICGHTRFHMEGSIEKREQREIAEVLDVQNAIEYLLSNKYFEGFLWNKLFCARLIDKLRFDKDLHFCEDLLFVNQCLLKSNGAVYVAEALYEYRLRENGLTYSYNSKRRTELQSFQRMIDLNRSKKIVEILQFRYLEAAVNLYRMAVLNGDLQYAPYLKKEALRYWKIYFFSKTILIKEKIRAILILMFPRVSDRVWRWLKRNFGLFWNKY